MSHDGDGDDEYPAGVARSSEECSSCSTQPPGALSGQPPPFYMGGLGAALPSPPSSHWQCTPPPLNYPPQYTLHRPQPQPQYHPQPYGTAGYPTRQYPEAAFDAANYAQQQQVHFHRQQPPSAQPPQYNLSYLQQQGLSLTHTVFGVLPTHWGSPPPPQMQMQLQQHLPLPPPPLPPSGTGPPLPPLPGMGLPPLPGHVLPGQPPEAHFQQQLPLPLPLPPRAGGWERPVMPHSPSNVGLPGPSWAAPPLSLADSGGWERPSSPLIFEEPSQIVSALPPPQPLPPRPGFGSRGRRAPRVRRTVTPCAGGWACAALAHVSRCARACRRPSVVLTNFTDLAVGEVDVFKHDVTFTPEMKTSQARRAAARCDRRCPARVHRERTVAYHDEISGNLGR